MCTFDHVGIYVVSVPCVHLIYTWNRSYLCNFCSMCTFDHVGIYVPTVPCVHLIMLVFMKLHKYRSFCSCTFDHVGIYVASVPCVHLIMLFM